MPGIGGLVSGLGKGGDQHELGGRGQEHCGDRHEMEKDRTVEAAGWCVAESASLRVRFALDALSAK